MVDIAWLTATTRVKYPDDEQGRRKIDDDTDEREDRFSGKRHFGLGGVSSIRWLGMLSSFRMEAATERWVSGWVSNIYKFYLCSDSR